MKKLTAICLLLLLSGCMTSGQPCDSSLDNCAAARRLIMQEALYYRAY